MTYTHIPGNYRMPFNEGRYLIVPVLDPISRLTYSRVILKT